jgi:EAL domain-containing protein (putative c-di-GMP-specific phosphodiesterase class I)
METIAEGVETADEYAVLASQGCRLMQGYHFSKPLPPVQFETWVQQWAGC